MWLVIERRHFGFCSPTILLANVFVLKTGGVNKNITEIIWDLLRIHEGRIFSSVKQSELMDGEIRHSAI